MKNFKNKTVVVTGAAMGIGKGLSKLLLKEGCKLALVDINKKMLEETTSELSKLGECRSYICDITDRAKVYETAKAIKKELGTVSLLINNAGIVYTEEFLDLDDNAIEKVINVNLISQFWTCKAFLPDMVKQDEGHIVNIASAAGILAIPNLSVYNASKFGVVGLSNALRQEMKKNKYNVKITYICPNTINTGMFEGSKMVTGTSMLNPDNVCKKILKGIKKESPVVAIPTFALKFLTPFSQLVLPVPAMDFLNKTLGMWDAQEKTTTREKQEAAK